ncbi:hypothetical protein [Streptomyces rubiginosohelvolus]
MTNSLRLRDPPLPEAAGPFGLSFGLSLLERDAAAFHLVATGSMNQRMIS